MANVPTPRGLTVAPSKSAATPLQRLDAPALAFGSTVAADTFSTLGKVSDQRADALERHATEFQAINNKVAADQRAIDYTTDTDNQVLDFQANNNGMAAYDNLPKVYESLEASRAAGGEGLSPDALIAYNSASRNQLARAQSTLRTYAQTQRKGAVLGTEDAKVAQARAAAAGDEAATPTTIATIADSAAFRMRPDVLGWTKEQASSWMREQVGSIFQDQIRTAVNIGDYPGAEAKLEAHKGDMTAEQIMSVSGAMKVGRNAFEANSFADEFMSNGVPRVAGTEGNPLSILKSAAPGATVTSNKRSVAHNAEVHGVANSDHLTGEAADFTPAKGQSMSDLANQLRGAHVGEVINEGNHIHVEWGKGAGTKRWAGAPSPTMDPDAYENQATLAAMDAVKERFPNNPVLQQQALSAARQRITLQSGMIRNDQQSRYTRLLSAVVEGGIQSTATLANAYPGATSDLAGLPGGMQLAITNATKGNANALTPDRQLRIQTLNGMRAAATDLTSDWFKQDLTKYDLPPGVQTQLMKQQAEDKAKVQKKVANTQQDNTVQRALSSVSGKAAMSSLGIHYTPTADAESNKAYFQFAGALKAYTENYHDVHGKLPDQKAMDTIISQVTATTGKTPNWHLFGKFDLGFGGDAGEPKFTVPEADRQAIIDLAASNGLNLTENQISAAYQRNRNRAR